MHCPGENVTDPIWRVLASSLGISSWTPLKPQHSNPDINPLANQLLCSDFLTPPTPLIIPYRLSAFLESLMPLMIDSCKMVEKQSHQMYSNNVLKFQESMTILNACPKKVWKLFEWSTHTHTHIYIYILSSTDRVFRCIKTLQCG